MGLPSQCFGENKIYVSRYRLSKPGRAHPSDEETGGDDKEYGMLGTSMQRNWGCFVKYPSPPLGEGVIPSLRRVGKGN